HTQERNNEKFPFHTHTSTFFIIDVAVIANSRPKKVLPPKRTNLPFLYQDYFAISRLVPASSFPRRLLFAFLLTNPRIER
ncbi:MAG TPA: hypothetical protein VN631_09600, partial [Negativicutes bacterium]|nr:hypothetical protein [Negativicutes bacterium]